jgi:hypothetical protein
MNKPHANGNGNGNGNGVRAGNDDWTPTLVLEHVLGMIGANDTRYREAFIAAKEAVATAFVASEKATAQAFASSEKAIRDALAAVEKSTAAAFVAAEKAVALAEANAERWRQDAQEWRARMTTREKDFSTTIEFNALKERLDRGEGSSGGMRSLAGWIFGGIMAFATVGSVLLAHLK